MNHFNKVIIQGNIVRDFEVKYTGGSTAVANFTIASNRKFKDRDPEVAFIDVTLWGKLAETIGAYAKKGMCILVEGRIVQENWTDNKTSEKRSKLALVADAVQLPPREKTEGGGYEPSASEENPF